MNLLLVLIIAILLGFIAKYVAERLGADSTIAVLIGVAVGIIAYLNL